MILVLGGRDTLPPWILQVVGLIFLACFIGYWMATGNWSPGLVAASGVLWGSGTVKSAGEKIQQIKTPIEPPTAPERAEETS